MRQRDSRVGDGEVQKNTLSSPGNTDVLYSQYLGARLGHHKNCVNERGQQSESRGPPCEIGVPRKEKKVEK